MWQVSWAHPKFGVLLASCSYDGRVIIFRESPANNWQQIYVHAVHESSVSSIQWAPYEYGLCLACASSDGSVSVLTHTPQGWVSSKFQDSTLGCNSVSWAPAEGSDQHVKRLVTGSCDYNVKIWRETEDGWKMEERLVTDGAQSTHGDWVRDVAWAPNSGLPTNIIASCSEDKKVFIFSQELGRTKWEHTLLHEFAAPVWRVSWSITGHVLAVRHGSMLTPRCCTRAHFATPPFPSLQVSSGDHQVTLWKQSLDRAWRCVRACAPTLAVVVVLLSLLVMLPGRMISSVSENGTLNVQQ